MTDPHDPNQPPLDPSTVRRVGVAHGRAGVDSFAHLVDKEHRSLYDEGYAEGQGKKVEDDDRKATASESPVKGVNDA